eukprot:6177963-Pleurochrysis_carterae.AAC.1
MASQLALTSMQDCHHPYCPHHVSLRCSQSDQQIPAILKRICVKANEQRISRKFQDTIHCFFLKA